MAEGTGKSADDFEAEALPERDGAAVAADDDIELHRGKAASASFVEAVGAHRAGDAAAARGRQGGIAGVANVIARAELVGPQVIGAENGPGFLGDEDPVRRGEPVSERVLAAPVAGQGEGFARADVRFDHGPDRLAVGLNGGADQNDGCLGATGIAGHPSKLSKSLWFALLNPYFSMGPTLRSSASR